MSSTRRVLIIYTGGTIGMQRTARGFAPAPGLLARELARMPQFQDPDGPPNTTPRSQWGTRIEYRLVENAPILDSSNMGVEDWVALARQIQANYDEYDAFVVLHGTDTMAYTASALSFMLGNLGKTVVLTGSQIPLVEYRSDALANLLGALTIAGHFDIPEVGLYFHEKLMRGNRTRKMDAAGLDAFHSNNLPPLARMGVGIDVGWHLVRPMPKAPLIVRPITELGVACMRVFPGLTAQTLDGFLRPPLRGVVLETYGTGNVPDDRPEFIEVLRAANERGIVVVNCTQCARGAVTDDYVGGRALRDAGVVPGADLTPEAALTKLGYLLSRDNLGPAEVKQWMLTDLRGEITPPEKTPRFSFNDRDFVRRVAAALKPNDELREAEAGVDRAIRPVVMCSAASRGDVATLQQLIDAGTPADAPDYDGRTPLHLAAAEGQLAACRLLVNQGADVNAVDRWGGTPLRDAMRAGRRAVVAFLEATGARFIGDTATLALCAAADAGRLGELVRLVDAGANPEQADADGRTPLQFAAAGGHHPVVLYLLAEGVTVQTADRWGITPLMAAKQSGRSEVVELIERAVVGHRPGP